MRKIKSIIDVLPELQHHKHKTDRSDPTVKRLAQQSSREIAHDLAPSNAIRLIVRVSDDEGPALLLDAPSSASDG